MLSLTRQVTRSALAHLSGLWHPELMRLLPLLVVLTACSSLTKPASRVSETAPQPQAAGETFCNVEQPGGSLPMRRGESPAPFSVR